MNTTNAGIISLYPPMLPQMTADNVINVADLINDGGVIVVINEPQDALRGDYLTLYWNGTAANTLYTGTNTPSDSYPWTTIIPSSAVPDGSYQVYYTRVDQAANIASSLMTTAIVRRSDTGDLPAPDFPEANNNTITADDIYDDSTPVHIPVYSGMTSGDQVTIYWAGTDHYNQPVPASVTSLSYIVKANDLINGFSVNILAPYVSVIGVGTASSWYSVLPVGGVAKNSDTAVVQIDITQISLIAPIFTEGNDGWIDTNEAVNGTPIAVPAYSGISVGDVVTVSWQGYTGNNPVAGSSGSASPHAVSGSEIITGFQVTLPYANMAPIGVGTLQAWYQVDYSGSSQRGISAAAQVNLDILHPGMLPPPTFPAAAGDNTITSAEVTAGNGTEMDVTYSGMTTGDIVTAFWLGYVTSPGTPVPGTQWTQTRTLTAQEAQLSLAVFHIPASAITPVGKGYGEGKYQVMFNNQGGTASSVAADVKLDLSSVAELSMSCSTGAPIFDPTVMVRPLNTVVMSGPPGADVELSLATGSSAWFNPNGTQTLHLRLDSNGRASADVYSLAVGNVLVSAYVITNPILSAAASMTFTNWINGNGDLQFYGFTTGASADGIMPCCVWLKTSSSITATQARLTLNTGDAIITQSGIKIAFIDISTSHAGGFDVIDTVVETVAFTLSLPDVSNANVTGSLSFITPL